MKARTKRVATRLNETQLHTLVEHLNKKFKLSDTFGFTIQDFRNSIRTEHVWEDLYSVIKTISEPRLKWNDDKVKEKMGEFMQYIHDEKNKKLNDIIFQHRDPQSIRKTKVSGPKMNPKTAWAPWQIQVLKSKAYQDTVKRYINTNDILNKLDVNQETNQDQILVLLNFNKLGFSDNFIKNIATSESLFIDHVAAAQLASAKCHIPLKLIITNLKETKDHTSTEKDPKGWQYALVVDWNLHKFPFWNDAERGYVDEFYEKYHSLRMVTGIKSYDFSTQTPLEQLKTDLIDTIEILPKTVLNSGPKPTMFDSKPRGFMGSDGIRIPFLVADTLHDYGRTEHMKTYISFAMSEFKRTTLNENVIQGFNTLQKTFGYTKPGTFDDTFIDIMRNTLFKEDNGMNAVYDMNKNDLQPCKRYICSKANNTFSRWGQTDKQKLLEILTDNSDAKAFMNFGAVSKGLFEGNLKAMSAAARYEGLTDGIYMANDTGYGFSEHELLYFKSVVVSDGYVYVFENNDKVHRMPYTDTCKATNFDETKDQVKERMPGKLSEYFSTCLEAIDDIYKKTLAYYDLKRIADSIGIKAALHHRGVFVTHDEMALIGARLYGCPAILTYGSDVKGSLSTYHPNARFVKTIQDDHTHVPETPSMLTPIADTVAKVSGATQAVSQVVSEISRKRERSESVEAQPLVTANRRVRVRAPEPPSVEQVQAHKIAMLQDQVRRLFLQNAIQKFENQNRIPSPTESEMMRMSGGEDAPIVTQLLYGSVIELLIHKSTKTKDLVLKTLQDTVRDVRDGKVSTLTKADIDRMQKHVTDQLNKIYAVKFGIRTPLDHAMQIYHDPVLSVSKPVDYRYKDHLLSLAFIGEKNKLRRNTKSASLKSVSLSASKRKSATVKSAPAVLNATRETPRARASSARSRVIVPVEERRMMPI